jgi:hypothetical protein
LTGASIADIAQALRTTWPTNSVDNHWRRSRVTCDLLHHPGEFPSQTWQN